MMYGYARVSSKSQDHAGQVEALRAAGCEKIVTEKLSGKSADDRKAFQALLAKLEPSDVLVVTKLDRAARNLRDLLNLVEDLASRQIGFKSLGDPIDTTSLHGRLVTQILGCIAEFERGLIRERCAAGMAWAKAEGRSHGRKHALNPYQQAEALRMLAEGETQCGVARLLGVGQATIARLVASTTG
jgi:DNA invertase Pin-like site-specific DNA recombinase